MSQTHTAERTAAACVALLGAMTRRRDGASGETEIALRAYVAALAGYPQAVLQALPHRWTQTDAGQWWPTVHEITLLADRIERELAARGAASEARRIGSPGGVTLQPSGATAAFVAAARDAFGDAWVAGWLGQPDRAGEHTPAPWVRYTPDEIHTTAFGAERIRLKAAHLLSRHGVRVIASEAAQDMAADWAASMQAQQAEAAIRRRGRA